MLLSEAKRILKKNGYCLAERYGRMRKPPEEPANGPTPDNITYHSINPDYSITCWYDRLGFQWTIIVDYKTGEKTLKFDGHLDD